MQELVPLRPEDRDQSHALDDSDELLELTIQHRLLLGEETELEEEPITGWRDPKKISSLVKNKTATETKEHDVKTHSSSGSIAPV